jgi:hypothetical protein
VGFVFDEFWRGRLIFRCNGQVEEQFFSKIFDFFVGKLSFFMEFRKFEKKLEFDHWTTC